VTKRTVQNWVEKAAVGAAEKNGDSESPPVLGGDSSTGWLAQLEVYLYELSSGFQPQEQVVDSKP
jgi:putative transposase